MVRGRAFDDRDNETVPRVVIVDETLAQHFWPNHGSDRASNVQPERFQGLDEGG